jgi:hypothetical protein
MVERSPAFGWRITTGLERGLFYRRTPMTLTYRGVAYDSQSALLTHLLDKFKKEQRLEKELKKDRERIAASSSVE